MLKYTILLLTIVGLWQPADWFKGWKTYLYTIYTYFVLLILYSSTFSEFLFLVKSHNEVEEIASNSFMLLSMISVCVKAATVVINKGVIFDLIILLEKDPYQPKNYPKSIILNEYNDIINKSSLAYIIMVEVTLIIMMVTFSINSIPSHEFITNIWVPYDDTTLIGFWFTYICQVMAHVYGASISAALDALIVSMMFQICCQFSILHNRFKILPDVIRNIKEVDVEKLIILETIKLGECIKHHLQIYEWAERCNNIFSGIIFLQYSTSSIVLCVSVFSLSQIEYNSPDFPAIIIYLFCMLTQIFMICYSGSQVTAESIRVGDSIYCMDWSQFDLSTKKSLLMILKRTMNPVIFSSFHFVTLSIDSFTDLIKLSYSAFNLLNRSSG